MLGRVRAVGRWAVRLGLLALLAALLASCSFESDQLGGFRFDDDFHLRTGERLDGDRVWVGSRLAYDPGSHINGDVTLIADEVTFGGSIAGDLTVIASDFTFDSTARVTGDLTYCADQSRIQPGAQVDGALKEECAADRRTAVDHLFGAGPDRWQPSFLARLLGTLGRVLFLGGIAALGMILFPAGLRRMSSSVRAAPLAAAGIGCLTLVAAVGISVIYGLSLILVVPLLVLPVFLLAWLALGLALLVGWTAFAHPVGRWLLRRAGAGEPPPMVQAAVGGLALGLMVMIWDLFWFTGWIGTLATMIVSAIGLGAVILTRLGTRPYPAPAPDETGALRV